MKKSPLKCKAPIQTHSPLKKWSWKKRRSTEFAGLYNRTSSLKSDGVLKQAHETIQHLRLQCLGCPGYEEGECPTCSIECEIQGIVLEALGQQLEQTQDRHKLVLVAKKIKS